MKVAIGLTDKARADLREFVSRHARTNIQDTQRLADCLEQDADWSVRRSIELGSYYTQSRCPAVITFSDADLTWEDIQA